LSGFTRFPKDARTETFEFPFVPSEEELGLKLAVFFGADNYRFNEALQEVKECVLVMPGSPAKG